jgi:predicted GNAT family acetyltransferase
VSAEAEIEVVDVPGANRFEARRGGEVAGYARYVRRGGRVVFVHTEVDERYEGQGVGSRLVADALGAVRAAGEQVVPLCPFVADYLERHPDDDDLVDHALLDQFEEPG